MANAFQRSAFQDDAFQGDGSGFTPPPVSPGFTISHPAGGKAKKRQRAVVEIDGEKFEVRSEAEAEALLERAQELAQEQAPIAAKSALNKARKLKRKTGAMPTLEVAVPELRLVSGEGFGDMIAAALFDGMRGMGRLWQAAGTVQSILRPGLLEKAVECGLRSLFVGFETLNPAALREQRKFQNLRRDYGEAIARLHDLGVMVNASFVFGMDGEDLDVFSRTVEWAIGQGVETATFHILTPYPGTALYKRMVAAGRMLHGNWDLYDTRHVVYRPEGMRPEQLEAGYWRAYRDFYRWGSIARGAMRKPTITGSLRHAAYAAGWKKFEWLWDAVIRGQRLIHTLPVLETVLSEFGRRSPPRDARPAAPLCAQPAQN